MLRRAQSRTPRVVALPMPPTILTVQDRAKRKALKGAWSRPTPVRNRHAPKYEGVRTGIGRTGKDPPTSLHRRPALTPSAVRPPAGAGSRLVQGVGEAAWFGAPSPNSRPPRQFVPEAPASFSSRPRGFWGTALREAGGSLTDLNYGRSGPSSGWRGLAPADGFA